jgi:RimJ/RimL family protein N-acetyltransferase
MIDVATPVEYPRELVQDARLRDGSSVHIRPIRPDDAPRLQDFYGLLSRDTAYQRFFMVMKRLPPDWARILATVDYRERLALLAEHDGANGVELVGVGRYEPTNEPDTVEVAFVVQDGWQNRGLGTILFRQVLDAAAARGMRRFRAYVLANNRRMLDLITRFGDVRERKTEQGVTELLFTRRAEAERASVPSSKSC